VESNPAREFLTDNYCEDPQASGVETKIIYKWYAEFCEESGYHKLGEAMFGKEVRRVFRNVERCRVGTKGNRFHVYRGLHEGEKDL
jgi:phage/plasmid-associated DNA primase